MSSRVYLHLLENQLSVTATDSYDNSTSFDIIDENGTLSPDGYSRSAKLREIVEKFRGGSFLKYGPTGILPPGVLFINENIVIFERPPDFKNVFFIPRTLDHNFNSVQPITYRIPLPWQLYIVHYSSYQDENSQYHLYPVNVKMHFMHSNLYDLDQEVFLAPLPNFYTDGMLCRPFFESMEEFNRYGNDIAGVVASAYDWIWSGGTNADLTESVVQQFIQYPQNGLFAPRYTNRMTIGSRYCGTLEVEILMKAWESKTIEDILNVNWPINTLEHSSADTFLTQRFQDLLHDYLAARGIAPMYSMHEDDQDGYYQCDDEHCSCHHLTNILDNQDLQNFMYSGEQPKYTARHSLESFLLYCFPQEEQISSGITAESAAARVNNLALQLVNNG